MALGTRYFLLNHSDDWNDAVVENMHFENDNLIFKNLNGEKGIYISRSFDSMRPETVWNRLKLYMHVPSNILLKVRIYSSDSLNVILPDPDTGKDKEVLLDNVLTNKDMSSNYKLEVLDYIGSIVYESPTDIVMHGFKGRYLWISMEVLGYNDEPLVIEKLKIEFPRVSFMNYLPDIYRKDQDTDCFLDRFISIFQSLYYDLEDEFDNIPRLFAVDVVNEEFLNWIAQWFSIENSFIWTKEKLRNLLKNIMEIYRMKGTKESIIKLIEIYSGIKPIIVEQFNVTNNEYYDKNKNDIDRLFGSTGYTFTILIQSDKEISSDSYIEFLKIIENCKPMDSICNLVVLNNKTYLDHHCYLGLNSYISQGENIILG